MRKGFPLSTISPLMGPSLDGEHALDMSACPTIRWSIELDLRGTEGVDNRLVDLSHELFDEGDKPLDSLK